MESTERSRPSPALAISLVALFVALSGSAVALQGKNSIDHNDLRKHVVHRGKIHNQAVTSAKVADESLLATDLALDSVTSAEIATNAVGLAEIATSAVGAAEIAANAVDQDEIENGSVGTSELAGGAVTVSKLNGVTATFNLDFGSIAADDCDTLTPIVTGATVTDHVFLTPDSSASSHIVWSGHQGPFDNFITVAACNPTDGAINPALTPFRVLVLHASP